MRISIRTSHKWVLCHGQDLARSEWKGSGAVKA